VSNPTVSGGKLVITGMARSGTTLLDKLLTQHHQLDLLSQPFPLLFVQAKLDFLEQLGRKPYFALNDDRLQRDWSESQWLAFLKELQWAPGKLADLFRRMRNYSGQMTKPAEVALDWSVTEPGFEPIVDHCMNFFAPRAVRYTGFKEILIEEFLPYLGQLGYLSLVIVRDPRDVVASANYPGGKKFVGDKKPTLFHLRTWRKSVEYCYSLRAEGWFHFLRYEDLVTRPVNVLNDISAFLGVAAFDQNAFCDAIRDRNGELWQANTSRNRSSSLISSKSVGTFERSLSDSETAYIEAVCQHEMRWLGYQPLEQRDAARIIRGFRDQDVLDQHELDAGYSSNPANIAAELRRLEEFQAHYSSHAG
jgi:hypothetical protein